MSVPNIEKLFQYLKCFSKSGIVFNGEKISEPITSIKLNSTIFNCDGCMNCGSCDPPESNLYSESEYQRIKNCTKEEFDKAGLDYSYLEILRDNLHEVYFEINGKTITIYEYKQAKNVLYMKSKNKEYLRCSWCFCADESMGIYKCRIHPVESITCIMPHLKTYHNSNSGHSSLGINQFGRNWALKCPVLLKAPSNEAEFNHNKSNVLFKLNRLNEVGDDLNIETYLPEVINYISEIPYENYKNYLEKNMISTSKKLF